MLVIVSVTRCVCAFYAVYTHIRKYTQPHTHTNVVINHRRFDMQIPHVKGISQLLIPVANPDFDSNFHFNFDLALLPFPTPFLLHLSLPWPNHPKLSWPSCCCVSKQPQISLTLRRFRQTKKKRKQSNVERTSAHYFPLRLNSAPITVPPPLHSLSPTLLHATPLQPPFATLFRCTQRLFRGEAGAKSCSCCSRGSTCCSGRFRLFWLLCVIAAACGMWHAACGMRHAAHGVRFMPDNILIGSTAEHLVQSSIKMNQFVWSRNPF